MTVCRCEYTVFISANLTGDYYESFIIIIGDCSIHQQPLRHYAPQFNEQLDDYKKSSACIKKLINAGHERDNIEVNGPKCELKGK